MEDAGYELGEYSVHFADETGDLVLGADIHDPPPSEQTPEMLAQSEECILQVNGGVRATTVPTTIPEGLAGEFIGCMRDEGYEVFDVEIVEVEEIGPALGGFSSMEDEVPESVVRVCEQELGLP